MFLFSKRSMYTYVVVVAAAIWDCFGVAAAVDVVWFLRLHMFVLCCCCC